MPNSKNAGNAGNAPAENDPELVKTGDPETGTENPGEAPDKDNDKKEEDSGTDKKIGLTTFLQLSEPKQNKYVEAILRNKRNMEAHTKTEWKQIVSELLNKKVK
jgi:hypothetical protein